MTSRFKGGRLGPYEILAALGAGGMGDVYRARDTRLGREVAVKVLPSHLMHSSEALVRFEREARAVAALNHPNILALHDVGRDGDVVYAVTELLEGETLRDIVLAGAMPSRRALDLLAQIARGLGAAHDRGIVHRDIKPENLFLTRDGRVKILDFGIATTQTDTSVTTESRTANLTQPGTVIGTPIYMAPEQIAAQPATAQSDVFAFGMVAHELLTGAHPFKRSSVSETMGAILRDDPLSLGRAASALPPGTARVLARCLEKQPANRPASMRDLALYLDALATAPDLHVVEPLEAQPDAAPIVRRRVFYGLLASALLIVALVGYTGDVAERAASDASATERARAERLVHRVQTERFAHVGLTADLIASFPELKALFGTDAATVRDFLVNHQALVRGAPTLIALLADGRVLARTDTASVAPPAPGDTWLNTLVTDNRGPAVVTIDGRLYHAARAASDAGGNTFGHVVAALAIDQEFLRALSDATQDDVVLLADRIVASTLRSQAPWTSLQAWRDAGGRADRALALEIGSRPFDAQEISLSTQPPLSAIVVKARDEAVPLGRVQNGLLVIALVSVGVAIAAAYWIDRSVRRATRRPHTSS